MSAALDALLESVDYVNGILAHGLLRQLEMSKLIQRLRDLAADRRTPYLLPRVHELRRILTDAGVGPLIEAFRRTGTAPEFWSRRFEYAWLHSTVDRVMAQDAELAAFDGRSFDRCVEEFQRLDTERLRLAAGRIRRLHGEYAIMAMNAHPDQTDLVRREANKKSRHLPLRQLLARAPDVLTRIAPCWLASPLSVSQLLDGARQHFDVVLFDEASQVPQEDAVPALLRARQVVVAGDRHQLPPTTFFATLVAGEDEEGDAQDAVEGFESILDTMTFLPNRLLEWHYRSEDERLIAFSNRHIYDDRLITFPSARAPDVITGRLVSNDPGLSSQEESSSGEVNEVVRRPYPKRHWLPESLPALVQS